MTCNAAFSNNSEWYSPLKSLWVFSRWLMIDWLVGKTKEKKIMKVMISSEKKFTGKISSYWFWIYRSETKPSRTKKNPQDKTHRTINQLDKTHWTKTSCTKPKGQKPHWTKPTGQKTCWKKPTGQKTSWTKPTWQDTLDKTHRTKNPLDETHRTRHLLLMFLWLFSRGYADYINILREN